MLQFTQFHLGDEIIKLTAVLYSEISDIELLEAQKTIWKMIGNSNLCVKMPFIEITGLKDIKNTSEDCNK